MTAGRVFVVGATGNVGSIVVNELLKKKIPVTVYVRNLEKARALFSEGEYAVVEGDFNDISPIEKAIEGHDRLFLLTCAFGFSMQYLKGTIAKWAYAAGVKQIVDISSMGVSHGWRTNLVSDIHWKGEQAILDIPNRGKVVTIRAGRMMHNMYTFDHLTPENTFRDTEPEESVVSWVSTKDIAAVAVNVLTEDPQKHDDSVYELVGDFLSRKQRAEILTRVLGKEVKYERVSALEKYNDFLKHKIPHFVAYSFVSEPVAIPREDKLNIGFPILLGRAPQTFEEFVIENKDRL